MSPVKTVWRYFLAHQDSKLESWLEEQARRGLHLTRPGLFRFSFATGEPSDSKYRLDYQMLRGAKRDEYLTLFRDAGWDFLGAVSNRYFFRARPDAIAPEIFSDAASKRDRIRRQQRVMAVLTAILAWNTSMTASRAAAGHGPMPVEITAAAIVGGLTLFGIWCIWRMQQAFKHVQ